MSTNPLINALAAFAYIATLVFVMSGFIDTPDEELSGGLPLLIPMVMLSLFTLSAGVMGYLFVYQPLLLLLDGHKKESLAFFLKTVGAFGAIVAVLLLTLYINAVT